jgi:hypothetical protein
MTNWRPIENAPKGGQEVFVRRVIGVRTIYEGAAIWRPATATATATATKAEGWMHPVKDKPVPEPTHWKKKGRGHPPNLVTFSRSEQY